MTDPDISWRKLLGIGAILLLMMIWAALVLALWPIVARWPVLVQMLFYLVMGLAWIVPLKPLIRWIETGRWGAAQPPGN